MTPDQLKAARKLLGWSRDRLSAMSDVSTGILQRHENGVPLQPISAQKLAAVRATLEAAGVVFTDCGELGVRLRQVAP